jgi:DNA-binding Lrp family transcriptional regulator
MITPLSLDAIDRRIIVATQAGLPICEEPYDVVARAVEISAGEVMCRLRRLLAGGAIRRIGAVPNHYALGYRANGMSVWDIADAQIIQIGRAVGALDFVSHCYHRPRRLPDWPYNLFAMVHGRTRAEVEAKVEEIAGLVAPASSGHTVLYSMRILKKTGLRLSG